MAHIILNRNLVSAVRKMKSVIVCNGEDPGKRVLNRCLKNCDLLIAADGGANTLLRHGFTPHFITGDMDSFTPENPHNFNIIHDADQESNDLEKALKLASARKATDVIVCGATGKRLDHALKNLSVILRYEDTFTDLLAVDKYLNYRILPKQFSMKTKPGSLISLFPMSGRVDGITTRGLKYPLNNEHLENGLRDGSSNEAAEKEITITYESGSLLLMTKSR